MLYMSLNRTNTKIFCETKDLEHWYLIKVHGTVILKFSAILLISQRTIDTS